MAPFLYRRCWLSNGAVSPMHQIRGSPGISVHTISYVGFAPYLCLQYKQFVPEEQETKSELRLCKHYVESSKKLTTWLQCMEEPKQVSSVPSMQRPLFSQLYFMTVTHGRNSNFVHKATQATVAICTACRLWSNGHYYIWVWQSPLSHGHHKSGLNPGSTHFTPFTCAPRTGFNPRFTPEFNPPPKVGWTRI